MQSHQISANVMLWTKTEGRNYLMALQNYTINLAQLLLKFMNTQD